MPPLSAVSTHSSSGASVESVEQQLMARITSQKSKPAGPLKIEFLPISIATRFMSWPLRQVALCPRQYLCSKPVRELQSMPLRVKDICADPVSPGQIFSLGIEMQRLEVGRDGFRVRQRRGKTGLTSRCAPTLNSAAI